METMSTKIFPVNPKNQLILIEWIKKIALSQKDSYGNNGAFKYCNGYIE